MTNATLARPDATEYEPYYGTYISKVPEGDVIGLLERQVSDTLALLRSIPEAKGGSRYAPGKWSIKEVIGHLVDSERVFAYRALRIARGDRTPLPGFDQDDYVRAARFDDRTLASLANELEHVRRATIDLFANLDEQSTRRRGTANGKEVSARAIAFIIAGHERHHVGILREKYLRE